MRVEALLQQHGALDDPVRERLTRAAEEFEAQLMKELLRPLASGGLGGGEDDNGDAGSGTTMTDLAADALGRSISARGGLGIAASIVRSLFHSETPDRITSRSDTGRLFGQVNQAIPLKSNPVSPITIVGRSAYGDPK